MPVAAVATVINAVALSASQLWVSPDASYYVELAGGIADRLNFRSELFLIRPPGYPLLLAGIFALFGSASPTAILVVQHAMVVATAVVAAMTAWHLTRQRLAAVAAGLLCAASLQLLAYANLVMTEVPYTLALVLAAYFLVRYHAFGGGHALALASLMAGVSYLFRPIGMAVVPILVLAALHRTWTGAGPRRWFDAARLWRPAAAGCALAVIPALAVAAPGMVQNKLIHGGDLSSRCANLALFFRVAYMDQLDSSRSEALADIKAVVNEAIARGALPPEADHRLWGPVWKAYAAVRGLGLAEASEIMGRASWDLIRENPAAFLDRTIRCSYWMIMVPDGFYRFVPGGTPGVQLPNGECKRHPTAEVFAASTYEPMMRPWVGPYRHYLPLHDDPTVTTPAWTAATRWFYRHVEKGPSILGLLDSPYEAFTWLCLLGAAGAMFTQNRSTWLLIVGVVVLQVVTSAFLAGPTPRYAVPVKPLLLLFPAMIVGVLASLVRHARPVRYTGCRAVVAQLPGT